MHDLKGRLVTFFYRSSASGGEFVVRCGLCGRESADPGGETLNAWELHYHHRCRPPVRRRSWETPAAGAPPELVIECGTCGRESRHTRPSDAWDLHWAHRCGKAAARLVVSV